MFIRQYIPWNVACGAQPAVSLQPARGLSRLAPQPARVSFAKSLRLGSPPTRARGVDAIMAACNHRPVDDWISPDLPRARSCAERPCTVQD